VIVPAWSGGGKVPQYPTSGGSWPLAGETTGDCRDKAARVGMEMARGRSDIYIYIVFNRVLVAD
jgi:hypothetical protein